MKVPLVTNSSERERDGVGEVQDSGDGMQQLCSPTRLHDNVEGVDEQAGLGENVGVQLSVGEVGDDGAASGL